jgi:hypothetical protein
MNQLDILITLTFIGMKIGEIEVRIWRIPKVSFSLIPLGFIHLELSLLHFSR